MRGGKKDAGVLASFWYTACDDWSETLSACRVSMRPREGAGMSPAHTRIVAAIVLVSAASVAGLSLLAGILVDRLWMEELGYETIFWRILLLRGAIFGVVLAMAFPVFLLNFRALISRAFGFQSEILLRLGDLGNRRLTLVSKGKLLSSSRARLMALGASLGLSLVFAGVLQGSWDTLLRFAWSQALGESDPFYCLDLGFYLFELPFYETLQNSLFALFLILFSGTFLIYLALGRIRLERPFLAGVEHSVLAHVCLLGGLLALSLAAGFLLDRYQLLFSAGSAVHGMGFVDYHVTRHGLMALFWASLLLCSALGAACLFRKPGLIIASTAAYALLMFILLVAAPAVAGKLVVEPNEFRLERPFIEHSIAMTRKSYRLDRFREVSCPRVAELTPEIVRDNRETIENLRLWDWDPVLLTYRQRQEIRPYYHFSQVDVDRYCLPGEGRRQVLLSARELSGELPVRARTWVNRHLQFTHGYGLAMSLASEPGSEGLPRCVIGSVIPEPGCLEIIRPEIYYPEKDSGYRIVNTRIEEFDHPKGQGNVYCRYRGSGGVPLAGFWRRLLFAWHLGEVNILTSDYLTPSSRVQIRRGAVERLRGVAPFLVPDRDPYLVLAQGRLYWILDAYTSSETYPGAEPYRGRTNYLCNAVKAVIDAYDGSVGLYVFDPEDPVIRVYRAAFPAVFRDGSEMPEALLEHVRYPRDLFTAQMRMYRAYHMTDPQAFYNQEDLWAFPHEERAGGPGEAEPAYMLMRLPGEDLLRYVLFVPLTPHNRANLVAWSAGISDPDSYGEVVVCRLPKDRLVYGPAQVEAMIDQDEIISRQLSLWDRHGSRVIRGNLQVVPLGRSILFVEPVYLVSESTNIPQMKRIILVSGQRAVMEPTLSEALEALFDGKGPSRIREAEHPGPGPEVRPEVLRAVQLIEQTLKDGDWQAFGRAIDILLELLEHHADGDGPIR
ncbi:MAG: UPF0182 family protein [Desulfomonilia bacterium]